MTDASVLGIGAVVAAIVLSYAYVRWRAVRGGSKPAGIAAVPPIDPGNPSEPTTDAAPNRAVTVSDPPPLRRRFPILISLLALGAAGLGQYALSRDQISLAWAGYLIGAVLFVGAVGPEAPDSYLAAPAADDRPASKTKSPPDLETPTAAAPDGRGFLKNWRHYTLADLLNARQPSLPPTAADPPALPANQPEAAESSSPVVAEPAGSPAELPGPAASTGPGPERASISVWSGFGRPESLAVASDGRVFVLDSDRRRIFEMDSTGQVLKEWPVQLEDLGPAYQLAVSPDGRSVYVVDSAHSRVLRIALED